MNDEKPLTESAMWKIFERSAFTDAQVDKVEETAKMAFYTLLKKERVVERILSLEDSRAHSKWIIAILLASITSLLAYIKI